jgi:putative DNA primase/helicase
VTVLSNELIPIENVVLTDPLSIAYAVERGVVKTTADGELRIEGVGRVRLGTDGLLYRYFEGVYLSDGEDYVRNITRQIYALAGKKAPSYRVNEVVRCIRDVEGVNRLSLDPDKRRIIRAKNGIVDPVEAWKATQAGESYEPEPYTPENATTVQLPWDYRQDADCPKIREFLGQVFHGSEMEAMAGFSWEVAGYVCLSCNPLRKAFLLFGRTRGGKSIYLWLLTGMIGKRHVSSETLVQLGSVRFSSAHLVGKLANISADIGSQAPEDSSIFKRITGNDYVSAEHKGQRGFDFYPSATLIFSANEAPASKDISDAFFARWVVMEFPHQFKDDAKKEAELRALVENREEMEGFLRYAVEGAGRVLERGDFEYPQASIVAHDKYRQDVDTAAGWLARDERVVVGDGGETKGSEAHDAYEEWMAAEGKKKTALGRNKFYDRLRQDPRIEERWDHKVLYFTGLKILPTPAWTYTTETEEEF